MRHLLVSLLLAGILWVGTGHGSAHAGCQTELKGSDGYQQLSKVLKCLNDQIDQLEARGGGTIPSVPDAVAGKHLIRLKTGCLVIPTGLDTIVDRIEPGDAFCTIDGKTASKVQAITDDKVAFTNPGRTRPWTCSTRQRCTFSWNRDFYLRVTNVIFGGPGKLFADIELSKR